MTTAKQQILAAGIKTAELLAHASYRESCYQKVLGHLLRPHFTVHLEVPVTFRLSDQFIYGTGRIDLVCTHKATDETFVIEIKANVKEHILAHLGQLARYCKHYSCHGGLLIYFKGWTKTITTHCLGC
jgi:hypothetical protein